MNIFLSFSQAALNIVVTDDSVCFMVVIVKAPIRHWFPFLCSDRRLIFSWGPFRSKMNLLMSLFCAGPVCAHHRAALNLFGIFNIVESVRLLMNISWYAYQYQVRLFAVKWDVGGSRNATHWICNETFLFSPYPPVYFPHSARGLRRNAHKI